MKAKRIDGEAVNGKRTVLSDVIPLDTPYAITFFPIYACNFKCSYCIHSLDRDNKKNLSDVISMDFELYKKCINDIAMFPNKLKVLHFIGYGEPLLHKDISKMVAYAVEKKVANTVDIVTNGALLNSKLSLDLINAGLSALRISVQGVNGKQYKDTSGVNIDFEEFVNNIKFFHENKGNTKLHIKIIDIGMNRDEEETFFEIFGDICDTIAIEHLVPVVDSIEYNSLNDSKNFNTNTLGNDVISSEICPQPFYYMQINPDGKCVPCCNSEFPISLGNCNKESIADIWNNDTYSKFRMMQLSKNKNNNIVCSKCNQYKYTMFKEEVLDNDSERLLNLLNRKGRD